MKLCNFFDNDTEADQLVNNMLFFIEDTGSKVNYKNDNVKSSEEAVNKRKVFVNLTEQGNLFDEANKLPYTIGMIHYSSLAKNSCFRKPHIGLENPSEKENIQNTENEKAIDFFGESNLLMGKPAPFQINETGNYKIEEDFFSKNLEKKNFQSANKIWPPDFQSSFSQQVNIHNRRHDITKRKFLNREQNNLAFCNYNPIKATSSNVYEKIPLHSKKNFVIEDDYQKVYDGLSPEKKHGQFNYKQNSSNIIRWEKKYIDDHLESYRRRNNQH